MKKIISAFILLLIFNYSFAATIRDNEFQIHRGEGINNITMSDFNSNSYMVTGGQPYEGTSAEKHYYFQSLWDYLKITVKAGRKKSEDVGNDFQAITLNKFIPSDKDLAIHRDYADELNFYVGGKLLINDSKVRDPVYLAQGTAKFLGGNPWWIGNITGKNHYLCILSLQTEDNQTYYVYPRDNSSVTISTKVPDVYDCFGDVID